MTLKADIIARISREGPMRLDEYISTCLLHPTKGYYTTRAPFGAAGDFVTAPEISQMFGELIGLALAQSWMDAGAPAAFSLVELGPGRGTLMADILRACARVPGFQAAAQVLLVEASPQLRKEQAQSLSGQDVQWIDDLSALPRQPLFLVANEFFDALPIRQFQRDGDQWRERHVGLEGDALTLGLGPAQPQPALSHRLEDTSDSDLVETCETGAALMNQIGAHIAAEGGAALIIDYGDWRSLGDTLQALARHQPVNPLTDPGDADLTAHVDFEALAEAAAPARHSRVTPQGVFLERLGITQRAQNLAQSLNGKALEVHIAAHRRLTHPAEMGNLFKVMAVYADGQQVPPGLEA